eukprot:GFUD01065044.1.p1 GENE.GFUD01065044.1~~GFUD01065044.1.p1  ORF type:complete len:925 (-),score=203.73 GFUD01065044.1:75-2849(-)
MYSLIFVLIVSLATVSSDVEWNYNTVRNSGKFCPERDSCNFGRSSRGSIDLDWKARNCLCDQDCSVYGDCCIDAKAFDADEQNENFDKFSCTELRQYGAVYMRTQCLANWTLPNIRRACEDSAQNSDPVGSMPVTSKATGITYKNYYCAVCNQASEGVQFWKPRLECPTLQGYNSRFNNITKSFLMENLKYNNGQWGVEFDTIGIPVFHACYFDPFLPDILEPKIRKCNSYSPISSCPHLYPDQDTVRLCGAYTGLVFSDSQAFRNTHCAICNNVTTDSLICIKLEGRRMSFLDHFKPYSFAILFDIGGSDGDQVGVTEKCFGEEIWDPFAKKCRNVICGEEGRVFVEGKCYKEDEVPTTTSTTTTTTSTTTTSTTTTTITTTSTTATTTITSTTTTPTITSTEMVPTTSTTSVSTTQSATQSTVQSTIQSTTQSTSSTKPDFVFPTEDSSVNFPTNEILNLSTSTSSTKPSTRTSTSKETETSTKKVIKTTQLPIKVTTTIFHPRQTITQPINTTSLPSESGIFKTCPKFQLGPEEFQLQNNSVYVPAYDQTYSDGHFWLSEDSVYICRPLEAFSGTTKFSPVMGYVTFACLGVSLVCLVVHLVISCLAPELQNLSGKNLFSLSLALVGAYTSFLANMFTIDISHISCVVLAVLMYYFYLAAFFWMLNIGFDVARTLKLATTELRLTSGAQWGKFLVYSFVGWIVPAIIAAAATVIDVMDFDEIPDMFKPGFGGSNIGLCWFSRRSSLIIYFVVPFSIIMALNLVFFLSSSCIVWETTRSSAKITTSGPKTNFYLYLRLSVLLGLSWIAGVVAGGLDLEPVWYVFLVLNTLQGLFILVFFSCSKKVVSSVKERLCAGSHEETNSTWQWSGRLKSKDQLDSRNSEESALSGRSSACLTGSGVRPFKYSATSYDQYHKYDQRFYS